jgi:4-methylaminobutanoate oxidase (formaldehyde-forming)
MSPDGRFLAGPVPEVPGLWVASGCNGSGFSSSPAIGEALAAWITGGRPTVDLSSLSPARFGSLGGGVLAARALDDRVLVERGRWQYSHYYDPLPA